MTDHVEPEKPDRPPDATVFDISIPIIPVLVGLLGLTLVVVALMRRATGQGRSEEHREVP